MKSPKIWSWQAGTLLGLCMTAGLGALFAGGQKQAFLPGKTSDGHHQIEAACDACHSPFRGVEDRACMACHAADLAAAKDSHGLAKFRDPRTADMLAKIDATRCVTCHREHVPQLTSAMGVSVPADFCHHCHADIATERPSHAEFAPDGCASTGCHRYHDNTALYEDFLLAHLDEPDTKPRAVRPLRELGSFFAGVEPARRRPLTRHDHDGKPGTTPDAAITGEWASSAHARGGVNCGDCHGTGGAWSDRPSLDVCRRCHGSETRGFLEGRHGMRLDLKLPAMTPGEARLPMKESAAHRTLGCGSCHAGHSYDTRWAAVNACLACHDDEHSRSYEGSPHARLWQQELRGELPAGSGVSCATCHLPRHTIQDRDRRRVAVLHNQNANLRPDDKFVRSVCLDCHGAAFTWNALADDAGVTRNFSQRPRLQVEAIDMVRRRANIPR